MFKEKWEEHRSSHPKYSADLFNPTKFQELVDCVAVKLEKFAESNSFDAIACSGNSGTLLCAALSYKIGIPLIVVRQGGTYSNSQNRAAGLVRGSRYVIVDDFICGGNTVRRIIREIEHEHNKYCGVYQVGPVLPLPVCVAIGLWHTQEIYRGSYTVANAELNGPAETTYPALYLGHLSIENLNKFGGE